MSEEAERLACFLFNEQTYSVEQREFAERMIDQAVEELVKSAQGAHNMVCTLRCEYKGPHTALCKERAEVLTRWWAKELG